MPIHYERDDDHIVLITIDRPEARNAADMEHFKLLREAWERFDADVEARVAIVTGVEDSFFSGADLKTYIPQITALQKDMADRGVDEIDGYRLTDGVKAVLRGTKIYKPIIAAVNGYALAGGCEILQATDLRVASRTASFGLSEAQRGLVPGGGSMVRLARQVPHCKAMEILLLGERMSAEEAHRIGLINEVVEPEEVMPRAEALAERLARNGPLALQKIKEAVLRTSGEPLVRAYEIENECAAVVMASKDAREGPRAFMEKREPVYTGE